MKTKLLIPILLVAMSVLFTACATILSGTSQDFYVDSTPQGASIEINGKKISQLTPTTVKLKKKTAASEFNDKNQYVFRFEKNGYQPRQEKLNAGVNGIAVVNVFLFAPLVLVDLASGAIWKYPKYVSVNLIEAPPATETVVAYSSPVISILYPENTRGFKLVEKNAQVLIKAKVSDKYGIKEILVNGSPASFDTFGYFEKSINLITGDNTITIQAINVMGMSTSETIVVSHETEYAKPVSSLSNTGTYYALIIGNNTYQDPDIIPLDFPISDASQLYDVLTNQYNFDKNNVVFIKNASFEQMIEAFDKLSNTISANDNLLIFYAGHGYWDETKRLGYWLPVDARKSNTAFWIPNSRISDYMGSIKSKHTLLIADACFSGSIFKTRSAFADAQPAINKLYDLPSKKAMTSGNLKEVPDRSVFLQFLVKRLVDNTEKYLSADALFASFRQAVLNNSPTEPQYGTIQNAGDEGGEFIFIRR